LKDHRTSNRAFWRSWLPTPARRALLVSGAASLGSLGCAGPTTPLGTVWSLNPKQINTDREEALKEAAAAPELKGAVPTQRAPALARPAAPRIWFTPEHQVLHGPRQVRLMLEDPLGVSDNPRIKVTYNGLDVTQAFLNQSRLARDPAGLRMEIQIPTLRLSSDEEHQIEASFRARSGSRVRSRYAPPVCRAFDDHSVRSTEPFTPPAEILDAIARISRQSGISPAFTAGLVAQESSFNPRTVSWAKAIGLTQVTTLAETEISDLYSNWPRHPAIPKLPAPVVKAMVLSGQVNDRNEWRLDTELSVRGGLAYVKLLSDRWKSPDNLVKLRRILKKGEDLDALVTRVVLASYNSGYTRVAAAIDQAGVDWMSSPELTEARRYVNRIFSFCVFFSEGEGGNETST
jgi:hypothetical protein